MRKRVAGGMGVPSRQVPPSERDLAAAWEGVGPADGALPLRAGGSVRVVYPGRRNPEAGPDYVEAVLETDQGQVMRGAVELHRRTSDWTRHGHGADPHYAGVVLHVVAQDDGAAARRPGGAQLPLLELDPTTRSGDDAVPAFPCAQSRRAGADLLPALNAAGDARFDAAVASLGEALAAAPDVAAQEQVAFVAIAEALGYSRNRVPMRALAAAIPLTTFPPPEVRSSGSELASPLGPRNGVVGGVAAVEARFLGTAGLLPSQRHLRLARRRDAYVETLERLWATTPDHTQALRAYAWEMGRVRPENAPVRRAVALAHLALRWPRGGLLPAVRQALHAPTARAALRALTHLVLLPCPPGYWAQHWDFGVPAKGESVADATGAIALIGPSRAADVVVNQLLPLAAALGAVEQNPALADAARAAYRAHPPLAENWITRLVRDRTGLLPTPDAQDPVQTARAQQGLISLYEGPCQDLHCHTCPLATDHLTT